MLDVACIWGSVRFSHDTACKLDVRCRTGTSVEVSCPDTLGIPKTSKSMTCRQKGAADFSASDRSTAPKNKINTNSYLPKPKRKLMSRPENVTYDDGLIFWFALVNWFKRTGQKNTHVCYLKTIVLFVSCNISDAILLQFIM